MKHTAIWLALGMGLAACAPKPATPLPEGRAITLATPGRRIVGRLYPSKGPVRVLLVVLHGDGPNPPMRYHYDFAAAVAHDVAGVTAAGLMRPGYSDPTGRASDGDNGNHAGGNYTPEAVDALDAAIEDLKAEVHPARVILVGHSGGAALVADLMSRYPDVAGEAVLVSCPCDVPAWRQWMAGKQTAVAWRAPVRSLSPQALVSGIAPKARVYLWVGARDATALPRFSQAYAEALRARGVAAALTILPGRKHGILLDPAVIRGVEAIAAK